MTNTNELFENLIELGMHPKEKADTITVMEKIGHFLDDAVRKLYKQAKAKGLNKKEASPYIVENLNLDIVITALQKLSIPIFCQRKSASIIINYLDQLLLFCG